MEGRSIAEYILLGGMLLLFFGIPMFLEHRENMAKIKKKKEEKNE